MKRIFTTLKTWFAPKEAIKENCLQQLEGPTSFVDNSLEEKKPILSSSYLSKKSGAFVLDESLSTEKICKICSITLPKGKKTFCSKACQNKDFDGKFLKSLQRDKTKIPKKKDKKLLKVSLSPSEEKPKSIPIKPPTSIQYIPNRNYSYETHKERIKRLTQGW